MTTLIACLSTGKGTWGHVSRLMQEEQWYINSFICFYILKGISMKII